MIWYWYQIFLTNSKTIFHGTLGSENSEVENLSASLTRVLRVWRTTAQLEQHESPIKTFFNRNYDVMILFLCGLLNQSKRPENPSLMRLTSRLKQPVAVR